jgi:glycosyltransferase involved in cell wall biosynthesis
MQRTWAPDGATQPAGTISSPPRGAGRHVVAFVTGGVAMAGAEHNMVRLSRKLDPQRWRVTVISPGEGELTAVCRQAGLDVHVLQRARLFSTSVRVGDRLRLPNPLACAWDSAVVWAYARRLVPLLKDVGPDLVVTKGMFAHLYGALAARAAGVPCLWHVEDWVSERWGGLFRRVFGRLAGWLPTGIVGCADPIARQMPESIRHKAEVIYNGVDAAAYRPDGSRPRVREELSLPPGALVVGNIARMTPWKGQRLLLEAFSRVAARFPESWLVFVGSALFESDAFEQSLRQRAAALGLSRRVLFLGYRRDVRRLLGAMDVFAYPSLEKDTGPLAVLEAMASGLPVVGFDIPGVRMFVSRPEEGRLVPVGDVDSLERALVEILADRGLRTRLGLAARQRVEDCFTMEKHVGRFEEAFLRVMGARPKRPRE